MSDKNITTQTDGAKPEFKNLYTRVIETLNTNLEESSNVAIRWLAWRVKIGLEIAEKFWWDNCPTFAASLAYTTLLTLAPLLAVSLSILSSVNLADSIAGTEGQEIKVTSETALEFFFDQFLPPNQELADSVKKSFETFKTNAAPVSVLGLLFLIALVIWVLSIIESAFNMIWKVDKARPPINQFVVYWFTVTLTPFLIAGSIYLTAKVQALAASPSYAEYRYDQGFLLKGTPFLLTAIAFLLIYRLIPNTNVRFRPAIWGAVIASVLFETAKLVFNWYLREWASYKDVYGGLAIIPIFLFWLYVTWLIVLGGSVIAYAIQYPKEVKSKKKEGFDRRKYSHYYAIRILLDAARAYIADKGPLDPFAVQQKLEITSEFYGEILRKLHKLDIIVFLDAGGEKFLIKRPLDHVKVADVMTNLNGEMLACSPEPLDSDRSGVEELFTDIRKAMEDGLGAMTLQQLGERLTQEEPEEREHMAPVLELHKES
ncbi:MAG: YihY family inner membrane protein [Nitrospinota bacterium]|nr:YihY family inner membrane protein [Nitrospinota bacterium]MDH5678940.1 YihY family inner membrane protein [Nitrospinota bacterium]MDH5755758.1 YihY family inner membrane protein [Nitrospinota bacterium]